MVTRRVSDIKPDRNQPRKTFDDESLKHLAESILSNGLLTPIEIDENNVLLNGERRWRALKLAKVKECEVRVVKLKGNGAKRLRHQLVGDIQDEEIPTEERYEAIVKLYKLETIKGPLTKQDFSKELGLTLQTVGQAFDFCQFAEEEPELVKEVSPYIISETKALTTQERKEVIKEFKGVKDKKKDLIRELVRGKKSELEQKKQIEELRKTATRKEIKIKTDYDRAVQMREEIFETHRQLDKFMSNVRWARKTKFFFNKPKQRDNFISFLESASKKARLWAEELDTLRRDIDIEIIKE